MDITHLLYRYITTLDHDAKTLSALKADGQFSSINKPLPDLELDHIVPDELYLMLRVTTVLINALVEMVQSYDRNQHMVSGRQGSYKVLDGLLIKNLIAAIRDCGIHFTIYDNEDETVEWPSLLGPDKIKLLKHLPNKLVGCQPTEMVKPTQKLWKVLCIMCIYTRPL